MNYQEHQEIGNIWARLQEEANYWGDWIATYVREDFELFRVELLKDGIAVATIELTPAMAAQQQLWACFLVLQNSDDAITLRLSENHKDPAEAVREARRTLARKFAGTNLEGAE